MRQAALCCLLVACGGRASQRAGGAASGDFAGSGGAQLASGASANTEDGGERAGGGMPGLAESAGTGTPTGGVASGGAAPEQPLIEPGTRVCQDDSDCLGLECIGKAGQDARACTIDCSEARPCASNERCLSAPGLEPACFVRCDVGDECTYPFDCFDTAANGTWMCVPAPWTIHW